MWSNLNSHHQSMILVAGASPSTASFCSSVKSLLFNSISTLHNVAKIAQLSLSSTHCSVSNKLKKPQAIWALVLNISRALTFFTGPNKFNEINRTSQVVTYSILMKISFQNKLNFALNLSQLTKPVLISRIYISMCIE